MRCIIFTLFITLFCLSGSVIAYADIQHNFKPLGLHGLTSFQHIRTLNKGDVFGGITTSDPYLHGFLGMQVTERLAVGIRQTALTSDVNGTADRLFPGTDIRLNLIKETAYLPETNLTMISAIGHKRMASETLTFSKRFGDLDLMAGLAWGRLGSAAHIANPFKHISRHFEKERSLNSELPNGPEDWFTGENIGFFGGVSYQTPWDDLSLIAEWGADRYVVEANELGFDTPAPWAAGFDYTPRDWLSVGAALVGGNKIMGRLSLTSPISKWKPESHKLSYKDKKPMRPYRTGLSLPGQMAIAANNNGIHLFGAERHDILNAKGYLSSHPFAPLPKEIGRAATHMSNHAGTDVEAIHIRPHIFGLGGPLIQLQRNTLENAMAHNSGSPEEIWQNTMITKANAEHRFASKETWAAFIKDSPAPNRQSQFVFGLENDISHSEEDSGFLYRSSLKVDVKTQLSRKFMNSAGIRIDIHDNLDRLNELRPLALLPVRSNVDTFADRTISLDNFYMGWSSTLGNDLHVGLAGGYLEEMYLGLGGELLYRPFDKRLAFGAELWQVFKRDPLTSMNMGLNGDHVATGHLNAWYEFPDNDLTFKASIGRYLAEDFGATLSLQHRFKHGGYVDAFMTATDLSEPDIFGGTTNLYGGLKFTLPIGSLPYIPEGSYIQTNFTQIGRDSGQSLHKPMNLYDLTTSFSAGNLAHNWHEITK